MSLLNPAMYRKYRKDPKVRHLVSFMAILVSGFLQAFTLKVFIQPSNLLSSGFLGVSILIHQIGELVGMDLSISLMMLALNFEPIFDDVLLNVIFGGVLNGIYISIALKGNASTGGMDFIALFFSNRNGKTIWQEVFFFNTLLLLIFGAIFGWKYAGYSILFQYISTKVISNFHQRYHRVTLQITTRYGEEVMQAYLKNIRHGISCVEAIGGFSHEKMYLLHTVLSSYELIDAISVLKEADPRVIINQFATENFYGRFHRDPE